MRANHLLLMLIYKGIVENRNISFLLIDVDVDDLVRYPHSQMIDMYFIITTINLMVGQWIK